MHVEKLSLLTLFQRRHLEIKKKVYGCNHSRTFGAMTAPMSDAFPPAVAVPEKRWFTPSSADRRSSFTSLSPRHGFKSSAVAGLKHNNVTPPSCRCHSHHIPALTLHLKAENRRSLSDPPTPRRISPCTYRTARRNKDATKPPPTGACRGRGGRSEDT